MHRYLLLILIFVSSYVSASIIELPAGSYRLDRDRGIVICNTDLSKLEFDDQPITIKMDGNTFLVLDRVKELKVGVRYSLGLGEYNLTRYSMYFTELPLLWIDTTASIADSPKVLSKISLTQSDGNMIQSNAGIEYRGDTSQNYPKKSYETEFWNDNNGDNTVDLSLLGMREDKDWNIQAMYNEPLKISSVSAWEIWKNMSRLYYENLEPDAKTGVTMKYAEVFLNGSYQGVYAISEKVDRKQLKLKKNTEKEIRGELYKGNQWDVNTTYIGLPAYDNNSEVWGGYEYKYPKDLRDWTSFYNLHDFVINSSNEEFYDQYRNKYDSENLVNYFIFINTIRASDNMGKNLYTARYNKNEKYFFVPWDLDSILGRKWDTSQDNTLEDLLSNGLYGRLWSDPRKDGFRADVKKRWAELRSQLITPDNIMQILIDNFNYLKNNGVYERDQIAFPGSTLSSEYEEFAYIRNWLIQRINYLDKTFEWDESKHETNDDNGKVNSQFLFYPNPAKNYIYFIDKNNKTGKSFLDIAIYSMDGKMIRSISHNPIDQNLYIGDLDNGNYILKMQSDTGYSQTFKLIVSK